MNEDKREDRVVSDRRYDPADFQARIKARPTQYIKLPFALSCKTCKSNGGDCHVRRTSDHPNGNASVRCACCKSSNCSFVKIGDARSQAQLQTWLDQSRNINNASSTGRDIPDASQLDITARAGKDRAPPTTPASTRPQTPTLIKLKVPSPISSAPSSHISDLSSTVAMTLPATGSIPPTSRSSAGDGQGTSSKRSWHETGSSSSTNEAAAPPPPTKAARLEGSTASETPFAEELANQFPGQDHEFGRHILGLLVRHKSILKTQGAALATVDDLKQDLNRERMKKEALILEQSEARKNNAALVKEKTAAVLLAKDKAAEIACLKKERDEAKATLADIKSQLKEAMNREASMLEREKGRERERMEEKEREKTMEKKAVAAAIEREKEVMRASIRGFEDRLAEEERQHDLAVKNADASRHARNEAQEALAVVQADKDQLIGELKTMTANHEHEMINLDVTERDLEATQASLERARADGADLVIVRAELDTARSEEQRLLAVNAQLATSVEEQDQLKQQLEAQENNSKEMLKERKKMEFEISEARTEVETWRQKAKEYKWNLHLAQDNLLKSEMKMKESRRDNKEVKNEASGEARGEGSRVERQVIDMTEA
jgi:hypothetical protein